MRAYHKKSFVFSSFEQSFVMLYFSSTQQLGVVGDRDVLAEDGVGNSGVSKKKFTIAAVKKRLVLDWLRSRGA